MPTYRIVTADVRAGLAQLPDDSVHCCVTSPPYCGLRAYKTEPQVWGGAENCEHVWRDGGTRVVNAGASLKSTLATNPTTAKKTIALREASGAEPCGSFCQLCGAWRGELGSEPTIELYMWHLVEIFREVRRVLRRDGTLWLNVGDSYASGGRGDSDHHSEYLGKGTATAQALGRKKPTDNLKPKDLCMIPARLALALQADGWWLRSMIPWLKRSAMPESCTDRPGNAIEYFFLLTKAERYYYDGEAIKVNYSPNSIEGDAYEGQATKDYESAKAQNPSDTKRRVMESMKNGTGRNRRNADWFFDSLRAILDGESMACVSEDGDILALPINSQSTKMKHYATYPERLLAPCIKAGTSERGCCPACGAPWARVVEKSGGTIGKGWHDHADDMLVGQRTNARLSDGTYRVESLGWLPSCSCAAALPIPCTVLDPFSGTGTSGVVALELGRSYIGLELNPQYAAWSKDRLAEVCPLFTAKDSE